MTRRLVRMAEAIGGSGLALLALLLLAIGSAWFLRDLRHSLEDVEPEDDTTPTLTADHYSGRQMNAAGDIQYTLTGPHLERRPGQQGTLIDQPVMHTFTDRRPEWEVRADTGWVAADNSVIELREAVRAERPAETGAMPLLLTTRNVRLIPERRYGEGAEFARIDSPGGVATTVGFRVWLDENRIELLSQVRGTYDPPKR